MTRQEAVENVNVLGKRCYEAWLYGCPQVAVDAEWERAANRDTFVRMAVWMLDEVAKDQPRFLDGWKEARKK